MKKNINIVLVQLVYVSFFFTFYTNLFAQTDSILIEQISIEEGLSHRHVHCILQDSYGFLWIGTDDGLNRYDGYEFVVYKNNVWDTTSISSPAITVLTEDEKGNLWIGTPNGLNLYQRESDSFIRYLHDPHIQFSISDNDDIDALVVDRNNSNYIWIGTDGGGLNLFDIELQRFYTIKNNPKDLSSLSNDKLSSLCQDNFNNLWIGTSDSGLNRINLNSIPIMNSAKYDVGKLNSITFERYLNGQEDSNSISIASIYEDRTKTIWVLSGVGVHIYSRETNKFIPSSYFNLLPSKYKKIHFHEMLEDKSGMLWFGHHNQVFKLNRNSNSIKEYELNKEGTRSSSNQGLYEDYHGNIWAATWDGIAKVNRETPLFQQYYHNEDDPSLPASNYMYAILVDRSGTLWIGTYRGLFVMQTDKNGIVSFHNYSENLNQDARYIWSLVEDKNGTIWAALDYTLVRIDPRTKSIVRYKNDTDNNNAMIFQKKLGNRGSINLVIDNDENLWISAWGGGISKASLEQLYSTNNLRDVKFTNYFYDPDDPANLVVDFIQDRDGFLWICSRNGGVLKFDPEEESFVNYRNEPNNPNSLNVNSVNEVLEDKNGFIWVGTNGGGINKFNSKTELFTQFGTKDGFPSDIIKEILEDNNGNLWISTNRGITKFNPETKKIRNYDIQENEVAFHDKLSGKMYFGSDRGFIVFHPDSIKESKFVPPVVITKLTYFSDESEIKPKIDLTISSKDRVEFSYTDNMLSFEFAALGFNPDLKYNYSYQLEGLNNDWINIGNKREVTFTNLNPGDFVFKVKVCNEDGIWCNDPALLQIYISPPWWSTLWAYGVYGLLIIGSLYGIRRFEINRRKEKENRKILELENKRKTKELDQARRLQLSMLPKEIPCLPNLDIAVYMRTATEVGGDYYDFHSNNDTITAVIGDATGHGMNAGMMVSVAKGLFQNLAARSNLNNIISQFNDSILSMNLQPMYMSLHFFRINNKQMQVVGAGMPPIYYYQNKTGTVAEIESSGPPLGAFPKFKYELFKFELNEGDILALMTDGFAERMNSSKEIYGWEKGKDLLLRNSTSSANEIITKFVEVSDNWGGERPQEDDITFLVVKVK